MIYALLLQSVVTTCQPVMNTTRCTTESNGPIVYPTARPIAPYPIISGGGGGRYKPNKHAKKAGKMIAAGDCAGAEKYALEQGDFTLAGSVRIQCASRNSPK